jgi:2-polyprenyl-3-methyl-5-hydroxy-6-metoxy-1,4-benzoquinol methylase
VYPTIFAREGYQVTAIDIAPEAIRQVNEIAKYWGVEDDITGLVWDAHRLADDDLLSEQTLDRDFDAAILGEILEHVPDPEKIISQALKVVKVGGLVIASTPIGVNHNDPMHFQHWDDESINRLLLPFSNRAELLEKAAIAEDGCNPSCYLIVLKKKA